MAAGTLDFVIEQGATFQQVISVAQNNVAFDLTGYVARMQIRKTVSASTTIADLTSGSGLTIDGAAGTITVTIAATDTAAMTIERAVYDLEIEKDGVVKRLLQGKITLSYEVTR